MSTPQLLKGFRDFLPEEKRKRDYVVAKIKETFELFGFEPLETPTLEYSSLLLGKYGEEADKLVYRFTDNGGRDVALRYDQTISTARVIAENMRNPELMPKLLRRYQIQNVFRAEKPQRGRYREFTQCDCDIFGSLDPIVDADILTVFYKTYKALGLDDVVININSRTDIAQLLATYPLSNKAGRSSNSIWKQRVNSFLQSLDKLDKKTEDEVINELVSKGFEKKQMIEVIEFLRKRQKNNLISSDLQAIIDLSISSGIPKNNIKFTPFMVRGLDYYTGLIFEATLPNLAGSLGGGGRYNNLIYQLSGVNMAAVGFGIGFDRTVEILQSRNTFPSQLNLATATVLMTLFSETLSLTLEIAEELRGQKINTEIFGDRDAKLDKQLKYADKKGIPYVVIVGPEEAAAGTVTIKDLRNGSQKTIAADKLLDEIRSPSD